MRIMKYQEQRMWQDYTKPVSTLNSSAAATNENENTCPTTERKQRIYTKQALRYCSFYR